LGRTITPSQLKPGEFIIKVDIYSRQSLKEIWKCKLTLRISSLQNTKASGCLLEGKAFSKATFAAEAAGE